MQLLNNSLRQQIVLLLITLVLLTTVVIQVASWWSASNFNSQQISKKIQNAISILGEYSSAREELLITASTVLTADFGFKSAVATADKPTLRSMLENHGNRINADIMLLTDLDGMLIASSDKLGPSQHINLEQIIKSLQTSPDRAQLVDLNGSLYQMIMQPVMAPRIVGFTLIGFEIDRLILQKLVSLTMMDLSFLSNDKVFLTSLDSMFNEDDFISSLNQKKYD